MEKKQIKNINMSEYEEIYLISPKEAEPYEYQIREMLADKDTGVYRAVFDSILEHLFAYQTICSHYFQIIEKSLTIKELFLLYSNRLNRSKVENSLRSRLDNSDAIDEVLSIIDNSNVDLTKKVIEICMSKPKEVFVFEKLLLRAECSKNCSLALDLLVKHFGSELDFETIYRINQNEYVVGYFSSSRFLLDTYPDKLTYRFLNRYHVNAQVRLETLSRSLHEHTILTRTVSDITKYLVLKYADNLSIDMKIDICRGESKVYNSTHHCSKEVRNTAFQSILRQRDLLSFEQMLRLYESDRGDKDMCFGEMLQELDSRDINFKKFVDFIICYRNNAGSKLSLGPVSDQLNYLSIIANKINPVDISYEYIIQAMTANYEGSILGVSEESYILAYFFKPKKSDYQILVNALLKFRTVYEGLRYFASTAIFLHLLDQYWSDSDRHSLLFPTQELRTRFTNENLKKNIKKMSVSTCLFHLRNRFCDERYDKKLFDRILKEPLTFEFLQILSKYAPKSRWSGHPGCNDKKDVIGYDNYFTRIILQHFPTTQIWESFISAYSTSEIQLLEEYSFDRPSASFHHEKGSFQKLVEGIIRIHEITH